MSKMKILIIINIYLINLIYYINSKTTISIVIKSLHYKEVELYKLITTEKVCDTKIEYILDIVFDIKENFEGFERPISSIIQSKKNGNIIVSCWDGNIYLLTPPNLDYLLYNDNLTEYNEELGDAFV